MAALRSPLARTYPITTRFGAPNAITRAPHTGADFGAPFGTPVLAAAAGVARRWWNLGGGNMIGIDHGDGTETRYAHLALALVGGGVRVAAGQQIGTVGSTGQFTTGAHLHFEYLVNGQFVDPLPAIGAAAGAAAGPIGAPAPSAPAEADDVLSYNNGCGPGYLPAKIGAFGPTPVPFLRGRIDAIGQPGEGGDWNACIRATKGWKVGDDPYSLESVAAEIGDTFWQGFVGVGLPILANVAVIGGGVLLIYRGVITVIKP